MSKEQIKTILEIALGLIDTVDSPSQELSRLREENENLEKALDNVRFSKDRWQDRAMSLAKDVLRLYHWECETCDKDYKCTGGDEFCRVTQAQFLEGIIGKYHLEELVKGKVGEI